MVDNVVTFRHGNLLLVVKEMTIDLGFIRYEGEIHTSPKNWDEVASYISWLSEKYPDDEGNPRKISEKTEWVELTVTYDPGFRLEVGVSFCDGMASKNPIKEPNWSKEFANAIGFEPS